MIVSLLQLSMIMTLFILTTASVLCLVFWIHMFISIKEIFFDREEKM